MIGLVSRRIAQSTIVLLAMAVLVFIGIYAVGNPMDILISPEATQADIALITQRMGLDKPLWMQFQLFLKSALSGNLGNSFVHGQSALCRIVERMPATMELAGSAMLVAVFLGIPLGLYAGIKPNSVLTRCIMASSIIGFSLPIFWVGLLLIMLFSVQLGWLPTGGRGATVEFLGVAVSFLTLDGLRHLILPALTLSLVNIAMVIRLTRAGAQEVLTLDYIKFARAKGLSNSRIVGVHVLKNIMIPIVTVVALQLGTIIAFAVVTETIFSWPGMGKLIIDSITVLDRPVIVAYLLVTVCIFVILNLTADILYTFLDPRVRLGGSHD
jgi:peptide/nickel transport system permease protein